MWFRPRVQLRKIRPYLLALSFLPWAVGVIAQPCSIDLGADQTICQGQTVTLTAPSGFPNYLWSTGATTPSITVGAAGTYWGEPSYPSGELVTNGNFSGGNNGFSTPFTYNSNITTDGTYWIGTNAASHHPQLLGTGNGAFLMANAGWMHAGWTPWCQTIDVCPGQTYTLSVRLMSLASQGPPLVDWSVDGVQQGLWMQTGAQATWNTFVNTWTSGPTQTSATICLVIASGHGVGNDLGVDDISISGTIRLRDQVDVIVTPLPAFDLGPNATLCNGQNLVLDAAVPGGTYVWNDGSVASGMVVSGPGTYSVTVTANNCSATDAITVNYNPLPVVDLGPDLTLCDGDTQVLSATTPGATYTWLDGTHTPTYTVSGPGTYGVQVTVNNCSTSDAVDVTYTPNPVVDLGPDVVSCVGQTVTLDATTPGATYTWSDGSSLPTLAVTSDAAPSVVVTVNGCDGTDTAQVTFNPLPVVDLGPDVIVCPGTSVTLDATTPGASYVWSDGSTGPTLVATAPGTYTVDVTVNNCTTSDSFTLTNHTLPTVDLGPDLSICQGQGVTLGTTVPGASYTWSTGATTNTIGVSTAGTYWVDVTWNGCVIRDEVVVNVNPLPAVDLGVDRSICPGATTLLDATVAGATYAWSTGANTPTIEVGPGSYTVTVTTGTCSRTDAITIGTWPVAPLDLGPDLSLCPGAAHTLDASLAGASFLWNDGSTGPTITASTSGTYSLVRTDANGCTRTDAITVTFATPTPVDLGADTTLCQGQVLVLDASVPGATYAWSNGETSPSITVNATGNYSVVVTQGMCTVGDAVAVQVVPSPVVDLGADTTLCPGETLVLDATGPGLSYAWSTGASSPTITVSADGSYSVTVTNAANCSATDVVMVAYATPNAMDLGADLVLCQGDVATLDATLPGASYLWNTGATTPMIAVSNAGTYAVQVTQGSCSVQDTVGVVVHPMPVVDLGGDRTLCAGGSILLDATWPGATYLWSTGAQTPVISANTTGTYSVEVSLDGCTATDAVTITVLTAASVNLGADTTLCAGDVLTLDATTPGATYLWNTGAATPTIAVTTAGVYSVEVFSGQCSVSDQIAITLQDLPQISLGNDHVFCNGETSTTLDATWPGATYAWNTGATTATLVITTSGTYSVQVSVNGCSTTDQTLVAFGSFTYSLGPDVTLCPGETLELGTDLPNGVSTWNGVATTPTFLVNNAGTYTLFFTHASGCTVNDTIVVHYADAEQLDLGPDVNLCDGQAIELNATVNGATYLWNDGLSLPVRTVSQAGTYSVVAYVGNCSVADTILITTTPTPTVDLGPDRSICPGTTALFDATTPGATYSWHDNSTSPSYSATTAGAVTVTVTTNGCSASDQAVVTLLDPPVVALGNDTTICEGATLLLTMDEPNTTFTWDDGSTSTTRVVADPGTYWVEGVRNTCVTRDSIAVEVFSPADFDLGNDRTICAGTETGIGVIVNGATYLWNTGATTPTITVSETGVYQVDLLVAGCPAYDAIRVDVIQVDPLDLGPDLQACAGDVVVLHAPATNVSWSTGGVGPTLAVNSTGQYIATVDSLGCLVQDSVNVHFVPWSTELLLTGDASLCEGTYGLLQVAAVPGATYTWDDGSTGTLRTIVSPGWYSVHATGMCMDLTDSILVAAADCGSYLHVPNSFTPNNDGINDVFLPVLAGPVGTYLLEIFDRWGELIHSTTDPNAGWDGSCNGTLVQDGVYIWKLRHHVHGPAGISRQDRRGHVTLLR